MTSIHLSDADQNRIAKMPASSGNIDNPQDIKRIARAIRKDLPQFQRDAAELKEINAYINAHIDKCYYLKFDEPRLDGCWKRLVATCFNRPYNEMTDEQIWEILRTTLLWVESANVPGAFMMVDRIRARAALAEEKVRRSLVTSGLSLTFASSSSMSPT